MPTPATPGRHDQAYWPDYLPRIEREHNPAMPYAYQYLITIRHPGYEPHDPRHWTFYLAPEADQAERIAKKLWMQYHPTARHADAILPQPVEKFTVRPHVPTDRPAADAWLADHPQGMIVERPLVSLRHPPRPPRSGSIDPADWEGLWDAIVDANPVDAANDRLERFRLVPETDAGHHAAYPLDPLLMLAKDAVEWAFQAGYRKNQPPVFLPTVPDLDDLDEAIAHAVTHEDRTQLLTQKTLAQYFDEPGGLYEQWRQHPTRFTPQQQEALATFAATVQPYASWRSQTEHNLKHLVQQDLLAVAVPIGDRPQWAWWRADTQSFLTQPHHPDQPRLYRTLAAAAFDLAAELHETYFAGHKPANESIPALAKQLSRRSVAFWHQLDPVIHQRWAQQIAPHTALADRIPDLPRTTPETPRVSSPGV
ncbi:hypothetical protein [Sulfobacillus thermosulfidooxidans]|uniref:hypothetical protein n=1 Tax=Sulfobacillus thermosulfidooxidans TaxID=28034 RepID=UPI0006B5BF14|nr:hypothetical protein [Sulfobacillus thermosulfidooxidans]